MVNQSDDASLFLKIFLNVAFSLGGGVFLLSLPFNLSHVNAFALMSSCLFKLICERDGPTQDAGRS